MMNLIRNTRRDMKRFFVLLGLCLVCQQVFAQSVGTFEQWQRSKEADSTSDPDKQSTVIEFKGIPITGAVDDFAVKLQAMGYNPVQVIDNTVIMTGRFVNEECSIYLFSTAKTKQIWKVAVIIENTYTSWSLIKNDFNKYKELYSKKYGHPDYDYHFFSSPYYEGDGYEMSALKSGKCHYFIGFDLPGGAVSIKMLSSCKIALQYENTVNSALDTAESESEILNEI